MLIVLDDVGYGDTSTFGGPASTPALSRLASEGLRYNRFHTAGLCSPTRAALLSGRNHHRMGFGTVGEKSYPGYDGVWKREAASVAEVLRRAGYRTGAFGKWHNTPSRELTPDGPFDRWPTGLGFDRYYGNLLGMSSQWEPSLWLDTTPVAAPRTPAQGYHLTSDLVDHALGWLDEGREGSRPFFLYFSTGAAHTPHHVPQAWIDRYRGRFDRGWDVEREAIFRRQKALGVVPATARLTRRPAEIPAWDSLSPQQRALYARQMEVYAAFIEHTDFEIGRLLEGISKGARPADTLVMVLVGDNGPEGAIGLDGAEFIVATVTGHARPHEQQLDDSHDLGSPKYTNIYSNGWAFMGTTPFPWSKHVASHLGAVRNPLIVAWPGHTRNPEQVRSQFTHVTDVVPTLYAAAGITPPVSVDDVIQWPFDGTSFAESFVDPDAPAHHRVQYFEIEGNRALYEDGWLASARHTVPWIQRPWAVPPGTERDRWELYDLRTDYSQAIDLAATHPERLAAMRRRFELEATANLVHPIGLSVGSTDGGERATQKAFEYGAGFPGAPIDARSTPDVSRALTLRVAFGSGAAEPQGVLFAAGGRAGGRVLYLQHGELVYENNFLGVASERLVAPTSGLQGVHEIELAQAASHDGRGQAIALKLDGHVIAEGAFRCIAPPDPLDNFDVGRDTATPVSERYSAPFTFNGTLRSLEIVQNW